MENKQQLTKDDSSDKQNAIFYEEKLEADSFNAAMIDELFFKQKFKLVKKDGMKTEGN
jgi:hypothetical protein